ncbi:hypothetical protein ES288_D08G018300v1 [Gossypium darwinii]|uniref:Serine-threonine kinase receptor-associated protein n=1 Tax=Gossypium darwinii TaxID=34276 RepID=A0A5D2BHV5_GOSDA|nr:hypothetical protein ES288_D08G018300v1 [Gossypium darwinii]
MQRRFANPFQKKGLPNQYSFTLPSLSQAVITEIHLHPPSPSQHRQKRQVLLFFKFLARKEEKKKMRPILMKGYERPLTFLKYNRDGDLLFSCAKDHTPTVWFADNGERLGTYCGHNGAVWSCDVSRDSMRLITGSADQTVKLWNVQTGAQLYTSPISVLLRGRINRAVWGPLNRTIVSAGEDAVIRIWDSETVHTSFTGSLDKSAKLWDTRTLTLIKTYVTERPVNAVAMSPLLDHM